MLGERSIKMRSYRRLHIPSGAVAHRTEEVTYQWGRSGPLCLLADVKATQDQHLVPNGSDRCEMGEGRGQYWGAFDVVTE